MAAYVPYQVDYKVENKAKSLGFSKKKFIFKFGIANNQAIQQGLTGSNCRGSEHEITFIWSLKSGKRQIIADNKEVHFSDSGQNGWTGDRTFQHHFGLQSPGFGVIRCHLVTMPSDPNLPGGNRPCDLRIGGISYFDFSKIFQLGTSAMIVRPAPSGSGGASYRSPDDEAYASPEERELIARAKLESMRDIRQSRSQDEAQRSYVSAPAYVPQREESLISFDDPPLPPRNNPQQMSSMTMDPAFTRNGSFGSHGYGGPPPQQKTPASYSNYQLPPVQSFAPPPVPAAYSNYQLPPAPTPQYAASVPTYGQQSQAPTPQYAVNPPAYGFQQPAAYGFNQPAPYQQHAPPVMDPGMGFAQPPQSSAAQPGFTSPQSAVSYGSAPSFAQPPRQYGY